MNVRRRHDAVYFLDLAQERIDVDHRGISVDLLTCCSVVPVPTYMCM